MHPNNGQMLPLCEEKFINIKKDVNKIDEEQKRNHNVIFNLLEGQGKEVIKIGKDVAYMRGKLDSSNKNPGNTQYPGNPRNPGNTENPRNPGNTENPRNPGNTENNPPPTHDEGCLTLRWKNLKTLTKLIGAITSCFIIIGGIKLSGII